MRYNWAFVGRSVIHICPQSINNDGRDGYMHVVLTFLLLLLHLWCLLGRCHLDLGRAARAAQCEGTGSWGWWAMGVYGRGGMKREKGKWELKVNFERLMGRVTDWVKATSALRRTSWSIAIHQKIKSCDLRDLHLGALLMSTVGPKDNPYAWIDMERTWHIQLDINRY